MIKKTTLIYTILFCCVSLTAGCSNSLAQKGTFFDLITAEEAMQPEAPRTRSLFDEPKNGPDISIVKPALDAEVKAPFDVEIQFLPKQYPVDINSLKISLVKLVSIDLTDRVMAHADITGEGIRLKKVNCPQGSHTVRFYLSDVSGNTTEKTLVLTVK